MNVVKTLDDLICVRDSLDASFGLGHSAESVEIKVSMATCGIAAGAKEVNGYLAALLERERIPASIVQTGCMGYCYAEPTIEVTLPGGEPVVFGYVNNARVDDIVTHYIRQGVMPEDVVWIKDRVQTDRDAPPRQLHIALRNCGHIDPENIDDYIRADGYLALGKAVTQMTPDDVIKTIIDSGLRGRGGGGFPTGLKWQITRRAESSRKYVVCNADEGDPGAFMDRSILEGDPHTGIEARVINGYCTGADRGVIYIRAEYPLAVERLKVAMKQAKACGFLGERIFGTDFSFDIEIRYGAGAFVCGEETALIHSMEGERGEASVKPPFPSEKGYKGFPTNVNNVETYANIPAIILKGADWFSAIGTAKSKGTKVFALAGKINKVGLVEVPMGTTLREVIFEIGGGIKDGKKFKAVQTGGPSGGCLTGKHLDLPIDYDNLLAAGSMMGSGGMIVMDEDDCMVAMAQFYLDFSVEESCGKCTPCRIGNKRLHELLQKITSGTGEESDLERLRNLAMVIKDTALCGLGQTSPNPVLSTMDNFYDEYIAHVRDQVCPAHRCRKLTQYFIDPEKCTGCTLCSRACSIDAIKGERKAPHVIDPILCVRCGTCFDKCKFGAVYVL
jgi:NADH:ubiquinone oxidoreductase subunit F (NADH-binding)/(2Fe-2S) ferredoxin